MATSRTNPAALEAALAPLAPGYRALFDRAVSVLGARPEVRAVWVSGSVGRGIADAGSDLDLIVTVADELAGGFSESWAEWLAQITPTVLAKPLPGMPGSFYSVTPEWLRLDVVVEREGDLEKTFFRTRLAAFDPDGLVARIPREFDLPGPSAQKVAAMVDEIYRAWGLLTVSEARSDWLLGVEGCNLLRGLLLQLFAERNAPQPTGGMKRLSAKLTAEQLADMHQLPPVSAERGSVIRCTGEIVRVFEKHARPLARELGVAWPVELERATRERLEGVIGS